jgi:hypothetical protein
MLMCQLHATHIHHVHVQRAYRGHLGRAAAAAAKCNKQRGVLQYSSTDSASAIVTAHALLMLQLTRQVTNKCRLL